MRKLIKVKVFPFFKKEEIIKKNEDEYIVKTKEKPEKGRANTAVSKILSVYFQISPSKIILKKGKKERNKIFEIIK